MTADEKLTGQQQGKGGQTSLLESFGNAVMKAITPDHSQMPSFMGQMGAWFREGREDLANVVLHAFPDSMSLSREIGSPGSPTQRQVNNDLGVKSMEMER